MGLWVFLVAVFVLVWVQMGLGAWVSTNYAVLACQDFPTCQGSWWPAMNFAQGFEWWRPLGLRSDGQPIAFEALTAIHYVHRLLAYVVLAGLAWAGWRLRQTQGWHMTGSLLWLAGGWQLLTGVSNVVLGWPLAAAVSHTGGAAVTVLLLTGAILRARRDRYVIPSKVPLS
jgi:cytochrome c oxidase assembly protein subunit 15